MSKPDKFHASTVAIFAFACAVFVVAMVIAHGAAVLQQHLNLNPDPFYYLVIFTIWACISLLAPALCFHVFSRSNSPNSYWRAFWTFAYLALLVHLYWAITGSCGGSFEAIYKLETAQEAHPGCIVAHPTPDFFLAAWWGLDVVLAYIVSDSIKWVRVQRGAVHLLAFLMFFGAFVLAEKAGVAARLLGVLMAVTVLTCLLIKIIISENDPKSLMMVLYVKFFQLLNLFVVWHKLPTFLAVTNLVALREVLRAKNLHNTSDIPMTEPSARRELVRPEAKYHAERQEDGQYNDLSKPTMGNAAFDGPDFTKSNQGARFGRNIPLSEVDPSRDGGILDPNPRLVSNLLLARQSTPGNPSGFQPVETLNLLAAAWIQFQVHDWFNHGTPRTITDEAFEVLIPPGDEWPDGPTMRVRRTRADPTRRKNDSAGPETFANAETHWWDGSQIYGDSRQALMQYRAGKDGKLKIDPKTKRIPVDGAGIERTGLTANWWVGLSLLHNIFTFEHNAICDRIIQAYPEWREQADGDEKIFRVARLVNNALMAKIHTVDWTRAILTHPALQVVMNADWWGLAGEQLKKSFGRISANEAVSGIPGSATNHDGADYCLTEEFASVYRLHPLLPNDIQLVSHATGAKGRVLKFESDSLDDPDLIIGPNAMQNAMRGVSLIDVVYTFGVQNPGQIKLRNFPNWMRRLHRRNGQNLEELIDLAAIDIIRDRERGVPRYNRFREMFHMPRVKTFEEMSDDRDIVDTLRKVYGHPDKVDLMVGMYAEKPPKGFGFSDTAFRVFILMAPRRLKSDRFLTNDFNEAVYTKAGLDWINDNNMSTVLLRHFPELTPVLQRVANPFAPWPDPRKLPN